MVPRRVGRHADDVRCALTSSLGARKLVSPNFSTKAHPSAIDAIEHLNRLLSGCPSL